MPTTTSETVRRVQPYYESTTASAWYSPGWNRVNTFYTNVTKRSKTWPLTTKRVMPADPFLAGTSRTTSSVLRVDSGCTWMSGTYPRRLYENAVVTDIFPHGSTTIKVPAVTISRALMYNKARSDVRQEAVNLAMVLMEYRKTAKLFLDIAKVITSKGRSLVKRHPSVRKGSLNSLSKDASDAYLAYTYGISPFHDDMSSALAQMSDRVNLSSFHLDGVITRKASAINTGTGLPINSSVSTLKANWKCMRTLTYRTQYRAYLNSNSLRNAMVAYGFANIPALAYESTPFSFVLDWWVNLGEVLASLDNLLLLDKLYVIDSSSDRVFKQVDTIPSKYISEGSGLWISRTDARSAPVEISRVATLRYKPSVSLKHILNGTALINSLR